MFQTLADIPSSLPFSIGFSTKADGNMSFRLGEHAEVLGNRTLYFANAGVPADRLVTFFTEHRDDITHLDSFPVGKNALRGEKLAITDAIITRIPETGVFLTFADCVPFIVYDQRQHLMAFAHIGWRSMEMGFTQKVLSHLLVQHGCLLADLTVAIGPCIKKDSYLFSDPIQAKAPAWQPFLAPQPDGRLGIDLVGFCAAECAAMGIAWEQLFVEPMDTAADDGQFSHYAGTEGGRPHKQGRLICYGFLGSR